MSKNQKPPRRNPTHPPRPVLVDSPYVPGTTSPETAERIADAVVLRKIEAQQMAVAASLNRTYGKSGKRNPQTHFEFMNGFGFSNASDTLEGHTTMKAQQLAGIPFDIVDGTLREIAITTALPAAKPDSPIRQTVMRAVEAAYQRGLREGQDTGLLMTETAEELHSRRMDVMTHLNVVATMWASMASGCTISKEDMQVAAWIVGARMFTITLDGAGGMTFDLDFPKIEKGYQQYLETKDGEDK